MKKQSKPHLDFIPIRDLCRRKVDLAHAIPMLVRLAYNAVSSSRRLRHGVVKGSLRLGQLRTRLRTAIVFHKARVARLDTAGARGQRPTSNAGLRSRSCIDHSPSPGRGPGDILNGQVVGIPVITIDLNSTAHAGTTIGTIVTVGIAGRSTVLKGGEDGVYNAFPIGVGSILDPTIANIFDILEAELLGKVVPRVVECSGHVEWESNIS